jgi:hypothetical protein
MSGCAPVEYPQPGSRVRFVRDGPALSGRVKRAGPLLQNKTQNMNTNENLISTGCPAAAPQPVNQLVKLVKFPAQPQEWKIVSLREPMIVRQQI